MNSASDLSLDAAEKTTITVNMKTTADEYLGNPEINKGNILVCEANSSMYDSIEVQGARKTTTPTFWSVQDTSKKTWSYEIPKLTSKPVEVALNIDVDDTLNPATTTDDFNCTVIDVSYTLDADTYELITGYEDENGNDIGVTPTYAAGTYTFQIKVS